MLKKAEGGQQLRPKHVTALINR